LSRVYIIISDDNSRPLVVTRKANPVNVEYETKAKNLLKGELKRKGITYAQLAAKLEGIGVQENERNLNNKISRGGFSAAFLIQCLEVIGAKDVRLD
jgi:3-mercaptopyruvate sulfurtransferase SseA